MAMFRGSSESAARVAAALITIGTTPGLRKRSLISENTTPYMIAPSHGQIARFPKIAPSPIPGSRCVQVWKAVKQNGQNRDLLYF